MNNKMKFGIDSSMVQYIMDMVRRMSYFDAWVTQNKLPYFLAMGPEIQCLNH